MNHLKDLSRKEKLELIKQIQAGEIHVINGEIIEGGVVLIQNADNYYLNGKPVDFEELAKKVETVIILPEKKPG